MGRPYRLWQILMLTLLLSATAAMSAFASDVISSVKITVNSELEAGEKLPDIQIDGTVDSGDISVSCSSEKYVISDAAWVTSTSRTMSPGDTPELKVWLTAQGDYYFKGSYRSSNVTVSRGTFVSASRKDSDTLVVRLKVKGIEGTFDPPEDVYWKDNAKGTAHWDDPDENDTGKYELVLKRGSGTVYTVETTGNSYNFYPYMTKAGTYTFKIRTIAKTSKEEEYGKSSEWVESDEIYLAEEDVFDGTGQNTANGDVITAPEITANQVGWQQQSGSWYYIYPDGSYQKDSWLNLNDRWYLFDASGKMLKGWQSQGNYSYVFSDSGEMLTGWFLSDGRWYYLNPTEDQFEGVMLADRWLTLDGATYYLGSDGAMAEGWCQVDGSWYYFYPGSGQMATDTTIDTFYVDQNGVWKR